MKHSTFSKTFEELFTIPRLLYELSLLQPEPIDKEQVQKEIKDKHFFESVPKQSFYMPKCDGAFRQITLSDTKTKVIQKVLANELGTVMEFSDRSYAFRKGKSPYKAINRVRDLLKGYTHVAKADIQTFFDDINHAILIKKLNKITRFYMVFAFVRRCRYLTLSQYRCTNFQEKLRNLCPKTDT